MPVQIGIRYARGLYGCARLSRVEIVHARSWAARIKPCPIRLPLFLLIHRTSKLPARLIIAGCTDILIERISVDALTGPRDSLPVRQTPTKAHFSEPWRHRMAIQFPSRRQNALRHSSQARQSPYRNRLQRSLASSSWDCLLRPNYLARSPL